MCQTDQDYSGAAQASYSYQQSQCACCEQAFDASQGCDFGDGELFCRQCSDQYCLDQCGYCYDCMSVSSSHSSGGTYTVNGIGTKLYGLGKKCPTCRSRQQTLWLTFAYFPLIPLGGYRVIWLEKQIDRYYSRRSAISWGQVFRTWLTASAIVGAVVLAIYFSSSAS